MEYSSNRTYTSTGARSLDPIWSTLYPSSDIGNVNRLADQWDAWDRRTCARFCAEDGAWYLFQAEGSNPDYEWPGRWVKADDRQLLQATQFLGDRQRKDASGKPEVLGDWAQKSASSSKRRAALAEASGYSSLRVHREDFDQKPHLLLTAEGVVDIRTGDMELEANPRDMLMRMAGVEPHEDPFEIALHVEQGSSPLWESFLARVQPDPEVRAYLQRLAGYWLTG